MEILEPGAVPVLEAVEWRERAPGGGSESQVFRLTDNRFAIVKFPENKQGERVLVNELLACSLAEHLGLPVNIARLISIDERTIQAPRKARQIPENFSAGIRCGMIRFENNEVCNEATIRQKCDNAHELDSVALFERLVGRGDGRQLLMYPAPGAKGNRFAAFDYGFAFGGQPIWTEDSISKLGDPALPDTNPFGEKYKDGSELRGIVELMRKLSVSDVEKSLARLYAPRWGATLSEVQALLRIIDARAKKLVELFDEAYQLKQIEIPANVQ